MDYNQFQAEYQQLFDSIEAQPATEFAPAVARLKAMAAAIESPTDRRTAENQIATIEDILAYDDEPPLSPAMANAIRAHARAADHVPPTERECPMTYEEFEAEYQRVFASVESQPAAQFAPDVARLKGLAASLENVRERTEAENLIADLEGVLEYDDEPLSPAMAEAIRVHARADSAYGTPAERIAQLEAGMAEIARIAEAAEPAEQASILEMNESLYMLITSLEPEAR
ncbi:hypothetical protein [Kribbella sp. NPDC023855]|uniref:hypothetical protein n=1 Tax=Kribbella sp. NPDC023855 TaxID=3154698 RepID=UPI0033E2B494